MNTIDLNQLLLTTPLSAVPAIVLIVLTALTMGSVIRRERAMIPASRRPSAVQAAYMSRWRNRD
ncbi:hypothetical protein [Mycobacterium sp.]|uniref:hypothetical protein n=1 Tax=Mycobacterium sp. TaxID=1785 RepID=UPI003BA9384B